MRKIALAAVLLVVTLSLFASGTARDTVKVYFSVHIDGGPASQIWRCNVDGSEPELLYEGSDIGELAIDPEAEKLCFVANYEVVIADLDCTVVDEGHFFVDDGTSSRQNHIDAKSGYLCFCDDTPYTDGHVLTYTVTPWELVGGFSPQGIPGMPANTHLKGVALHVTDESPVQSTTWGRIKSAFR
jgi:hypothetical protein